MGHRGAEEGHDAVAQHLVHRALVAVHGVHHEVQGRVEELLGLFRVEVRDQLGGAFEVGKQHRDLLALAFQGAAGGENLLGEIGGRVRQRWRVPGHVAGVWGWRRVPRPDQHLPRLIPGELLRLDEFGLEILEVVVVEVEAPFERPIGHPPLALQQVEHTGSGLRQTSCAAPVTIRQSPTHTDAGRQSCRR